MARLFDVWTVFDDMFIRSRRLLLHKWLSAVEVFYYTSGFDVKKRGWAVADPWVTSISFTFPAGSPVFRCTPGPAWLVVLQHAIHGDVPI